jgi:hypothetical protein
VSTEVTTQDAREGTQGGKMRCKQRLHEATTVTDDDSGNGKREEDSDMVRVMVVVGSGKHQAWLPIDHYEALVEETSQTTPTPSSTSLGTMA